MNFSEEQLAEELRLLGTQDLVCVDSFEADRISDAIISKSRNRISRRKYTAGSVGVAVLLLLITQWHSEIPTAHDSTTENTTGVSLGNTTHENSTPPPNYLQNEIAILTQRLALAEQDVSLAQLEVRNQKLRIQLDDQIYAEYRLKALQEITLTNYSPTQ